MRFDVRFGLMESIEDVRFTIQFGVRCIEIFGVVFWVNDPTSKSYNIAYMITNWEHHPVTEEAIDFAARLRLSNQSCLGEVTNREALGLEILVEKLSIARSITDLSTSDNLIIQISTSMDIV